MGAGVVHEKTAPPLDLDVKRDSVTDELDALFYGEESRRLIWVGGHKYRDFVEELCSAGKDIDVPQRDGVERTRADGMSGHDVSSPRFGDR